jgi:hypothetical protein
MTNRNHFLAGPARRHALAWLLGVALLASAAPVLAATDPAVFAAAMVDFQRATGGDKSAIDGAAEQLTKLSQADPTDPVLRAYAGAVTAMRSTTTLLPWKKLNYAEDGLAKIDKALTQLTPAHDAPLYRGVPATLEVRFTAATTFLALPAMFNRHPRGEKLLDEVVKSPLLAAAPLPFKGAVWLRAGQQAAEANNATEARQWFDKVRASGAPQAPVALREAERL